MAKLYFYYAAMNAGKSTILLQSHHNYHEKGMNTLLFTPLLDTRHQKGVIHSRIGIVAEASLFSLTDNLFAITQQHHCHAPLSCVLVDEAQFLSKQQVEQLCEIADGLNIPVLSYGLRTDFQGELFEGSQFLLAWADELVELKTICHCGKKAIMSMRVSSSGQKIEKGAQIQIGGNESYVSVCRKHFKSGESSAKYPCNLA
jgi:thymidine kinase